MSPFDLYRQLYKSRWQTRLLMGRYRVHFVDHRVWTEAELREAWGK